MPKFHFRLNRLLAFRQLREKWARDAYLGARAKRLEAEEQSQRILDDKYALLHSASTDLTGRLALETAVNRLDDNYRAQQSVLGVLAGEETHSHDLWMTAKKEVEAIGKLREHAHADWVTAEERRAQAELDEWAVTRRAT